MSPIPVLTAGAGEVLSMPRSSRGNEARTGINPREMEPPHVGCHSFEKGSYFAFTAAGLLLNSARNRKAISQHILDVKRPECCGNEHPTVKPLQLLNDQIIEIRNDSMVTPENFLRPLRPVKSAGFELVQVEIKGFGHGSSVESNISRQMSKSKFRELSKICSAIIIPISVIG